LGSLPEDSWVAAAWPDVGEGIGSIFEDGEEFGIPAAELEQASAELRRAVGLDPEELFGPIGDAAFFASGEGIFGAGGGVVVETDDPDAAGKLVGALERAIRSEGLPVSPLAGGGDAEGFSVDVPDAPARVNVVAGEDRIVAAYGDAATEAALDPGAAEGTLEDNEDFAAAGERLGEDYDVSAYVDFAPLVDLLELAAVADPSLQQAMPYLSSLDYVVAGTSSDGERDSQRLFLGVDDVVDPTA
jgi:hypothetical protein